tara:strand:- start:427 stop:1662 length:1236 start_codon:yes stop_codon:yes gene_type:complete
VYTGTGHKTTIIVLLNLGAVKKQIDVMVQNRKALTNDYAERVERAVREWRRWASDPDALSDKIAKARTSWLVAQPIEGITAVGSLPSRPGTLTVVATDGSQIFPDRNEVASCFLINLGYVSMTYGTCDRPEMGSEPELFFEDEDLYQDWSGHRAIITREQVGHRRMAMEFTRLVKLAEMSGDKDQRSKDIPIVAMSDGTLILWMLEGKPPALRREMLRGFLGSMDQLRKNRTPVCGYISSPGGSDVVNPLRVGMCPETPTVCDRCPWMTGERTELPCDPINGVTDAALYWRLLEPGERSALFESASKILDDYGPHSIVFFYVHTGQEIGRVEVPLWVAQDEDLLNLIHAAVIDQCRKGRGYPVVLSESHEQAVVKGTERELFYSMLRDAYVKNRMQVGVSVKQLKKKIVDV